jgi:general secretion pathway protein H
VVPAVPARFKVSRTGSAEVGFTLIELLVVLFIAGLIMAAAAPLLSGTLMGVRLQVAARDVAVALGTARSHALMTGTPTAVRIDPDHRQYGLSSAGPEMNALPNGVEMSFSTARRRPSSAMPTIDFFADGSSSGGIVTLKAANARYQVTVDWLTGRISVDG